MQLKTFLLNANIKMIIATGSIAVKDFRSLSFKIWFFNNDHLPLSKTIVYCDMIMLRLYLKNAIKISLVVLVINQPSASNHLAGQSFSRTFHTIDSIP